MAKKPPKPKRGKVTNRNPSPETRFGAERGPATGKTAEQKQAEMRNAWLATEARTKFLQRLNARIDDPATIDAILDRININALLKDSEDRGLGAPKAAVDLTTNGKDVKAGIDLSGMSTEALAELVAAADATKHD